MESLVVNGIPAVDGNVANLFLQCTVHAPEPFQNFSNEEHYPHLLTVRFYCNTHMLQKWDDTSGVDFDRKWNFTGKFLMLVVFRQGLCETENLEGVTQVRKHCSHSKTFNGFSFDYLWLLLPSGFKYAIWRSRRKHTEILTLPFWKIHLRRDSSLINKAEKSWLGKKLFRRMSSTPRWNLLTL
jgi:hypothetical protein